MNLSDIKPTENNRPPRIILCGVEKSGKSTFCSQMPKPLFIPMRGEEGIDSLNVEAVPTIENHHQLVEALAMLTKEKHDYKTIVIDSVSALEPIIWAKVIEADGKDPKEASIEKVGGGYGKGYTEALSYWQALMFALDELRAKGIMTVLIGHVVVRLFVDPLTDSYDSYELDVHKKASASLYRWADTILFVNKKISTEKEEQGFNKQKTKAYGGNESFLHTQKRPSHPGGGRGVFGQLPYQIPLKWTDFKNAIKKAKETK